MSTDLAQASIRDGVVANALLYLTCIHVVRRGVFIPDGLDGPSVRRAAEYVDACTLEERCLVAAFLGALKRPGRIAALPEVPTKPTEGACYSAMSDLVEELQRRGASASDLILAMDTLASELQEAAEREQPEGWRLLYTGACS
ncbi:MAG: hypothetical protein AAFX81_16510 [Pseudomonadota bacterium]